MDRAAFTREVVGKGHLFRRTDALTAGFTQSAVRRRLASGQWVVVAPGIYLSGDMWTRQRDNARWQQATRVVAWGMRFPGAVASGVTAATLHGLWLPDRLPTDTTALTRATGSARSLERARLVVAQLPEAHVCRVLGVPATSTARTAIDLARHRLSFTESVMLLDAALHVGDVSRADLEAVLRDCHVWPGIARAARAVEFADELAETALESLSRVMFRVQGLEMPETQVRIGPYRVDFLWRRHRTIGEADGLQKYAGGSPSDPGNALIAEKLRQEWFEERGYHVVRWTWRQADREPQRTVARIRGAFARHARLAA